MRSSWSRRPRGTTAAQVRVFSPVYPGQNVGRQGADIHAGQALLDAGDHLTSSRVGAIAALGFDQVEVFARPRVAILSTGNEIVSPGRPLEPGQIYDINRFTLGAIVAEHGAVPVPLPTSADTLEDLNRALDAALAEDLVIFSGGSSVGERDLILDAIAARGEIVFHGIAVKPGKPTLFGIIEGKPVVGMPGYPTSCLSNGYMLVVPLLRRLARLPDVVLRVGEGPARASASFRRPAATSSTRCGSWTARRCPRSRRRATSRACRRPTATSKSRRRRTSWKRDRWSRSYCSDRERPVKQVKMYSSSFVPVDHVEDAEPVAAEAAIATVDHSDILGSSRIIVIRRERSRTRNAGVARKPAA